MFKQSRVSIRQARHRRDRKEQIVWNHKPVDSIRLNQILLPIIILIYIFFYHVSCFSLCIYSISLLCITPSCWHPCWIWGLSGWQVGSRSGLWYGYAWQPASINLYNDHQILTCSTWMYLVIIAALNLYICICICMYVCMYVCFFVAE